MNISSVTLPHETPKTLDEAIAHLCTSVSMYEMKQDGYSIIKDFLAQKFGAAYLKAEANPEALKILQELFEKITAR